MADHNAENAQTEMASQRELWQALVRVRHVLAEIEEEGQTMVPIAVVYDAIVGES